MILVQLKDGRSYLVAGMTDPATDKPVPWQEFAADPPARVRLGDFITIRGRDVRYISELLWQRPEGPKGDAP